jgi:hypothetical protein
MCRSSLIINSLSWIQPLNVRLYAWDMINVLALKYVYRMPLAMAICVVCEMLRLSQAAQFNFSWKTNWKLTDVSRIVG